MAEAIGLAIGAASLAGLFTTCVECIDYISLGRNHGRDYELSVTKLTLLQARLSAWGESLLVTQKGNENAALRDRWFEEQDTVGKCLVGIETLFKDGRQMESRYGLKPLPAKQDALSVVQQQKSRGFQQIESTFKSKIKWRQENVWATQKTRWAIRDKKKFDFMIADLAFFIGGLEDLSDRLHMSELQHKLLETDIQAITNADSLALLEDATNQVQALSQTSHIERTGRDVHGHTYVGTVIQDRAKVLNGNLGHDSQSSHSYHGTRAHHDTHVVQGDMSIEAATTFFN